MDFIPKSFYMESISETSKSRNPVSVPVHFKTYVSVSCSGVWGGQVSKHWGVLGGRRVCHCHSYHYGKSPDMLMWTLTILQKHSSTSMWSCARVCTGPCLSIESRNKSLMFPDFDQCTPLTVLNMVPGTHHRRMIFEKYLDGIFLLTTYIKLMLFYPHFSLLIVDGGHMHPWVQVLLCKNST